MNTENPGNARSLGVIAILVAALAAPEGRATGAEDRSKDEASIGQTRSEFVRAYNAGDVPAIVALFTADAEVVDEDGNAVRGREAIATLFHENFAANPGETMEIQSESLRFLSADVAQEEGRTRIKPAPAAVGEADQEKKTGTKPARGPGAKTVPWIERYLVLYVRQDGRWLQSSVRELDDNATSLHERLEPLAWLVGDWVDEGSESVVVSSNRWSEEGNALIRDFTIHVQGRPSMRGTQRIFWDPLKRQIMSWTHESQGGHWTANWAYDSRGNRWVVKSSGVYGDGQTGSSTQIFSVVSPDQVRWKAIDRTVGDQVEPDIDEFVMVRRPPRPGHSSNAAAARPPQR